MLKVIAKLLRKIADNIDCGNSNLSEQDTIKILDALQRYSDKEVHLSKYQACQYLNMSRASFDNHVRAGHLPKGIKQAGFKELSWRKKDLDSFVNYCKADRHGKKSSRTSVW